MDGYMKGWSDECKTHSLKMKEGHRLRESESKMLRRISGHNREEVTRNWGRLQTRSCIISCTLH
jgi:hypothetical protein